MKLYVGLGPVFQAQTRHGDRIFARRLRRHGACLAFGSAKDSVTAAEKSYPMRAFRRSRESDCRISAFRATVDKPPHASGEITVPAPPGIAGNALFLGGNQWKFTVKQLAIQFLPRHHERRIKAILLRFWDRNASLAIILPTCAAILIRAE